MSTSNNSAGVYVKEVDLSMASPSPSLTVTVGAIVGQSGKGPVMERTLITSVKEFIETFGEPDPRMSYLHYSALAFLERSNRLYVTRVIEANALTAGAYLTVDDFEANPSAANPPVLHLNNWMNDTNTYPLGKYNPLSTHVWETNEAGNYVGNAIPNVLGFFCATNPGTWNNSVYVRIVPNSVLGQLPADIDEPYHFKVEVFLNYSTLGTTLNYPVESYVVSWDYELDGFNRQMYIEDVINTHSAYIRFVPNPNAIKRVPVYTGCFEFLDGGANGSKVDTPTVLSGWELYRDPDLCNVTILINGGYTKSLVQRRMDEIARFRKDCIAILDMPTDVQESNPNPYAPERTLYDAAGQIPSFAEFYVAQTLNLDSSYSAIYTPNVTIYDEYNQKSVSIPPSGLVAACYARTDAEYATWFAPAGMIRGNLDILNVAVTYDQVARDCLTDNHINPIRVIPNQGFKVWGAETLQKTPSALSNVNVRRLLNFLEKSISSVSLEFVFSPNDAILRSQLFEVCDKILKPIKNARGLYWYKVICNETNNTALTVASNVVMLDIYIDPVLPAKRIHLNAIITRTGAVYNEIAADVAKRQVAAS